MTLSHRTIGLILGIVLPALMLLAGPPAGLSWPAWLTGCLLVLMATWWATEAIPIPATSLLPLIVLPFGAAIIGHGEHADAVGVAALSPRAISSSYMDPIVLLLLPRVLSLLLIVVRALFCYFWDPGGCFGRLRPPGAAARPT